MSRYLLDTNVISEARKQKPHGAVVAWLGSLAEDQVFVSAVTLGELQAGVELTRDQDPSKAAEIELWVDRIAESHEIVPMDSRCFREWGRLLHGKPEQLIQDAMIAATARIHGFIVATRNESDFKQLGVETINPFKT